MAKAASTAQERHWLLHLARQAAEALELRAPMTEVSYLAWERTLRPLAESERGFAQEVENDILEFKTNLERGDFSTRRLLTDASEDDFQVFLANDLALLGRKRYSVVREPQQAAGTRRDIYLVHLPRGWRATLELKVSRTRWTLADYRSSLKDQLVTRYLRDSAATVGFFVVLLQEERTWSGGTRTKLDFRGLLEILGSDALKLEAQHPKLRLRVLGIDASEGSEKARARRKRRRRGEVGQKPERKTAAKPRIAALESRRTQQK